ncbi:MAG: hypothetical protein PHP98_07455 [Kiritimatiellae bacterium]|nr:hypothetical protein [Kiritimatiellia bacterium]
MKPALRTAIVHYHCRPGGVTNVIRNAIAALRRLNIAAVALTGQPPGRVCADGHFRCVEGLDYGEADSSLPPDLLAERLKTAAAAALDGAPDIWHIHNHALGKNPVLTAAVAGLAVEGRRILLQIHDFAEDGRPANYGRLKTSFGAGGAWQNLPLYPQAAHVHYAVLNRRDEGWLLAAGADARRVHWLPNAVFLPGGETLSKQAGPARWVYPTRAIRRKNIGEFLLWAVLSKGGEQYALTLAPTNPVDCAVYERWKFLAAGWKLPVEFEAGLRAGSAGDIPWWRQGNGAFTTSVAEGFGLAFLEPWLAGLPLVGRDLPEITRDLKSSGIDLSMLYPRLAVPLKWLDADGLKNQMRLRLRETWRAYGQEPSADAVARAWGAAADDAGTIDFGRLDENTQAEVIGLLQKCASRKDELHHSAVPAEQARRAVPANASRVREQFSLDSYGKRLAAIYGEIMAAPSGPVQALPMEALLARILDPARFNLLRT